MARGGKTRILIVEDDKDIRSLLARMLRRGGYSPSAAADAGEARRLLGKHDFALILCDVSLPAESGLNLVRRVLLDYPDMAAVMVTGLADPSLEDIARDLGVGAYLTKPVASQDLFDAVSEALERRGTEMEERARAAEAGLTGAESEEAMSRLGPLEKEMWLSREEMVHRLPWAPEFRDEETARHRERLSRYCVLLARSLGLDEARCDLVTAAAPMHDIGMASVPEHILRKPGKLTPDEVKVVNQHSEIGYKMLAGSRAPLLDLAALIAWTHHERFDGSGFPRGLGGEEIPLEGRIVAIADAFDALTSKRAHRPPFPLEEALDIMRSGRGTQFDPKLLDLFISSIDEVTAIMTRHG